MKIVLAHKYLYRGGGTASYLFELIEELARRGHEAVPFTVNYSQVALREYQQYYVSPLGKPNATHLQDLQSPLARLRVLARSVWSSEAYSKARRLSRELKPDIAYVHNLYSYMSPSPIAAFKRAGLPVVMRVSDYNMLCPGLLGVREGSPCLDCVGGNLLQALRYGCHKHSRSATLARLVGMYAHRWLRVYDKVDKFVTPSRFMRNQMIKAGFPADRIVHLPSFYPPSDRMHPEAERGYMLYFGRIAPEKGIATLLDAMALLPRRMPLILAGADVDNETERLQQRCWRNRLTNVEFVGMQQRAELDRLIAGARFIVVPSNWYDNCPMAIFEAFAHGKPVIAADIGGIPEQVDEGAGVLFDPGDPMDLATKIEMLWDDRELREHMGAAALRRLNTTYGAELHCRRLLDIFESLLPAGAPQPQPATQRLAGAT